MLSPSDLHAAYSIPTSATHATVAIVAAFGYPHAESDLAVYRTAFGLPPCSTANGCFRKINESGQASPLPKYNDTWAQETALDIDMVSAVCPSCHILLVEATTNLSTHLVNAVHAATNTGARFVSMSWGNGFDPRTGVLPFVPSDFNAAAVVYVAAAGDWGYNAQGVDSTWFPAALPTVVSAGGTSLVPASNRRGWTETVWGPGSSFGQGTGSGCVTKVAEPLWQRAVVPRSVCSHRAANDVSMTADPDHGVAVFFARYWHMMGGTSVSTPLIASMYALAGRPRPLSSPAYFPYAAAPGGSFTDITSGHNYVSKRCAIPTLCVAQIGWDGPTGLGSPIGIAGFANPALARITMHRHANVTDWAGTAARVSVTSQDSKNLAALYTARGLPPGINLGSNGVTSGKPARAGKWNVVVSGHDATGAIASTRFVWTVRQHTFVATHKLQIIGARKVGHVLIAQYGPFHEDSAHGKIVKPKVSFQWYLNGHAIPADRFGRSSALEIARSMRGKRVALRIIATEARFGSYERTARGGAIRG